MLQQNIRFQMKKEMFCTKQCIICVLVVLKVNDTNFRFIERGCKCAETTFISIYIWAKKSTKIREYNKFAD